MRSATQFIIFLIGGMVFGFVILQNLMWAVYGAPTNPIEYLGLLSSVVLLASSFVCLFMPVAGRTIAICAVLGMGTFFIPASVSLMPAASTVVSPVAYVVLIGYFALLAFALFFPTRRRWSIPVLVCCLLAGGSFATVTYVDRQRRGDLQWPTIVCVEWDDTAGPLQVADDPGGWITPEIRKVLSEHGVTGTLRWVGTEGHPAGDLSVIVICSSSIPVPKNLPYPRQGSVIYLFDGKAWKSIPDYPSVFAAHATLRPDGMLEQIGVYGTQGSLAFRWR